MNALSPAVQGVQRSSNGAKESIEDSGRQVNSLQAPSDPGAEGGGIAELRCEVYTFFGAAVSDGWPEVIELSGVERGAPGVSES